MLETLGEKIHDGRFLRLVADMLSAGYLQDWRWGQCHLDKGQVDHRR